MLPRPTALAIGALLFGCSSLELHRDYTVPPLEVSHLGASRTFHHFVGVFHVHTDASHDGHGTLEEALQAARDTHCDFVVISDHNGRPHLGEEGLHDGVLLLVGEELTLPRSHYVALAHEGEVSRKRPAQEVIDSVREAGGLGFIAHPTGPWPWEDGRVEGVTGMEIYNYAADLLEGGGVPLVLLYSFLYPVAPDLFTTILLDRPTENLRLWDRKTRRGRVVGIAASDSHGTIRVLGMPVTSYEDVFGTVRNHVYATELSRDGILAAIEEGHIYVGFDIFGDTSGFVFSARGPSGEAILGDALAWEPGTEISVEAPERCEIRLLRDGEVIQRKRGKRLVTRVDRPGVYRVEAFRKGPSLSLQVPWIFSNPIYLLERPAPATSGQAGVDLPLASGRPLW